MTPLAGTTLASVEGINPREVLDISIARTQTLILKKDYTLWVQGLHNGIYRERPVQVLTGVSAMSAEDNFAVAVKKDGSVWSWGSNYYGELGDGTGDYQLSPVKAVGLRNVVAVSTGISSTIALKKDGTVWQWGFNFEDYNTEDERHDRRVPEQVKGLSDVVAISSGGRYAIALKKDGTVWAWGQNYIMQLGDGTQEDRVTPVQVQGLSGITAIAAGDIHSLALREDGTVWSWGFNGNGQRGDDNFMNRPTPAQVPGLSEIMAIAAKGDHSITLRKDGTLWAWGSPQWKENATWVWSSEDLSPFDVGALQPVQVRGLADTDIIKIWAGPNSITVLGRDRSLQEIGVAYSREDIAGVFAGGDSSIVVDLNGGIWSWGYSNQVSLQGNIGNGLKQSPTLTDRLGGAAMMAAGNQFILALRKDGTVWGWGDNKYGQLGDQSFDWDSIVKKDTFYIDLPNDETGELEKVGMDWKEAPALQVSGLWDVQSIAAGNDHALALRKDGTIWAWGGNMKGQLGDGTYSNRNVPVKVSRLTGITALSAGGSHSLSIKKDGTVWAWGANESGQLGDGTEQQRDTPVQVQELTDVIAVQAGGNHSLALKKDGTVWAWGNNDFGQLGDDTNTSQSKPIQVKGLTNGRAIAAGGMHSVAVTQDGKLWGWGLNSNSQLGIDKHRANQLSGAEATDLSDIEAISAGTRHTMALKKDGTVWVMGANNSGQIGVGGDWSVPYPYEVYIPTDGGWTAKRTVKLLQIPVETPADWAKQEVEAATAAGLIPDDLLTKYNDNITRAEFSRLVMNLLVVKSGKSVEALIAEKGKAIGQTSFRDTDDPIILAANALGIVNGKGYGLFDPAGSITRQEAAVMLARTASVLGMKADRIDPVYADSKDIASWAKEAVAFVSNAKDQTSQLSVMGGTGQNKFSPKESYTRQQSFITMIRLFNVQ